MPPPKNHVTGFWKVASKDDQDAVCFQREWGWGETEYPWRTLRLVQDNPRCLPQSVSIANFFFGWIQPSLSLQIHQKDNFLVCVRAITDSGVVVIVLAQSPTLQAIDSAVGKCGYIFNVSLIHWVMQSLCLNVARWTNWSWNCEVHKVLWCLCVKVQR